MFNSFVCNLFIAQEPVFLTTCCKLEIHKGNLIYICQVVCLYESSEQPGRWTNPHQIWYGGLTLQGPGHRLCFSPRGGPPGSGGP
jgi:hypothetical protein